MSERVRIAILGGTGYGAGELLRLLTQHPQAEVVEVTSSSQSGERVDVAHSHLRGFCDLTMSREVDLSRLLTGERAVIFSALPHGVSAAAIETLLRRESAPQRERLKIVDLSGDFRLCDETLHQRWYPRSPLLPDLRRSFVYGLPELNRDAVKNAQRVANPGCLATAAILAIAPLVEWLDGPIAVDAKTGSSGSGRELKETTHHPTRHADFRAYKPLAHQHEPEILQALGDAHGERLTLSFVAQSLDLTRGIFVCAHATLREAKDSAALLDRYRAYYASAPFVRVRADSPTLQDVVGSNFCDVSVAGRGKHVIAMAAIDNLVKGMAGAAIQNMNLILGLPETTGLWQPSFRPV